MEECTEWSKKEKKISMYGSNEEISKEEKHISAFNLAKKEVSMEGRN